MTKIKHNNNITNYYDGLKYLINSKMDAITYNSKIILILYNSNIIKKNENNNYYFEYELNYECDIIDNITFETILHLEINYIIENIEYKIFNKSLIKNKKLKIKFIFLNKPLLINEIIIHYKSYLINNN